MKLVKEKKYSRICDLKRCQAKFKTNYRNQRFCRTDHQQEYWQKIRSGNRPVEKELSQLRKRIVALEERSPVKEIDA